MVDEKAGLRRIIGIFVRHIKGIEEANINCNFYPNTPNFLVAPNGSGKSSLAIGFQSLNRDRLKLQEANCYKGLSSNDPELKVVFSDGEELVANKDKNDIHKSLKSFVINSGLYARQTSKRFEGRSISEATISIPDSVVFKKVPPVAKLNYSVKEIKKGDLHAVRGYLFNFKTCFSNESFLRNVISNKACYTSIYGPRYLSYINDFLKEIISIKELKEEDSGPGLDRIKKVKPLVELAELLEPFLDSSVEYYVFLNALQLNRFCVDNSQQVKAYKEYELYKIAKNYLDGILKGINTTGYQLKSKVEKGKLILRYPDRENVSNGELDILKFATSLCYARYNLDSQRCLLVIDEVFDYLDDGNLLVVQHFLLKLINEFKEQGRFLYIVILTHMDPRLMESYRFKVKHISYFGRCGTGKISSCMKNLLQDRDNCRNTNKNLYDSISQNYLHFSVDDSCATSEIKNYLKKKQFPDNALKPSGFRAFMYSEVSKYYSGSEYDPAKICCALRCSVEAFAYWSLPEEKRTGYLEINKGTISRFKYAEKYNINIPEVMYLLSGLYNECMHLRDNSDESVLTSRKLDNKFIKSMVREAFELSKKAANNK